jgi:hypothetical protein
MGRGCSVLWVRFDVEERERERERGANLFFLNFSLLGFFSLKILRTVPAEKMANLLLDLDSNQ